MVEKAHPASGAHATYIYGLCIQKGILGFTKNKEEGLKIIDAAIPKLKELAEQNDGFACLQLYKIYSLGNSNESVNVTEANKWLQKGLDLKNPLCFFYATRSNLIDSDSNQKILDEALISLENMKTYFRFPIDSVREIYREAILANFNKHNFIFEKLNVSGNDVQAQFKNRKLKYSLYLTYKILDNGKINKAPILFFVYDNPKYNDIFNYSIDMSTLNNFIGSWEKIIEWSKKVEEIQPPAFSKCINVNRNENENPIHFTWNGKSMIWLEEGNYPKGFELVDGRPQESTGDFQSHFVESLSGVEFFLSILLGISNADNDVHSFNKLVQNGLKNLADSEKKNESIINNNFN